MLLDGVFEMSKAFPSNPTLTEKLDHALDMMTANGWSEHVQGSYVSNASRLITPNYTGLEHVF